MIRAQRRKRIVGRKRTLRSRQTATLLRQMGQMGNNTRMTKGMTRPAMRIWKKKRRKRRKAIRKLMSTPRRKMLMTRKKLIKFLHLNQVISVRHLNQQTLHLTTNHPHKMATRLPQTMPRSSRLPMAKQLLLQSRVVTRRQRERRRSLVDQRE